MEAASQESLLTSAGFKARTPSTPKQKAAFEALPPYKLHRGIWKGKTIYAYKDEKAGVAYIGNKANYAQFQQLAPRPSWRRKSRSPKIWTTTSSIAGMARGTTLGRRVR